MSTALTIPGNVATPVADQLTGWLQKAASLLTDVESFDDLEDRFLRGRGLSPRTYEAYVAAAKSFYDHTDGLHPLQASVADIERWAETFDNANTRALRVAGLRAFYRGICEQLPFAANPFEAMSDEMRAKLAAKPDQGRPKRHLNARELQSLHDELGAGDDLWSQSTLAMVRLLVGTGMRAREACGITWAQIREVEPGRWYVLDLVGKGGRVEDQEIADPRAVPELRKVFRRQHHRWPTDADPVLWSLPEHKGGPSRPMSYGAMLRRIKELGHRTTCSGRRLEWTVHLMRRTAGSILADAGMPVTAVQRFLRHRSLNTTMRHYVDSDIRGAEFLARALAQR